MTDLRRAAGRDRSPLVRPIDRARSALGLITGVLLLGTLAVGLLVGLLALHSEQSLAAHQAATRRLVTAVTTSPAYPAGAQPVTGGSGASVATAAWTGPDGHRHTATIAVPDGTPVGGRVHTWTDRTGAAVGAPTTASAATLDGILVGTAAWIGAGVLVGSTDLLARHRLNRRADRAWEREWQRVEPSWSGRGRFR
ncbi:Rv1733c family protein [Phaeacidiphilus oryzae]|uniref:Rv1733c family protein n=1 Tax=Phaeacidiphilus oryzae TaxID=348818 RepID=UPI00126A2F83|nr:hypothetical protein [Phaeacidiphilus oryzae]